MTFKYSFKPWLLLLALLIFVVTVNGQTRTVPPRPVVSGPLDTVPAPDPIIDNVKALNAALLIFTSLQQALILVMSLTMIGFGVCYLGRHVYRKQALAVEINKYAPLASSPQSYSLEQQLMSVNTNMMHNSGHHLNHYSTAMRNPMSSYSGMDPNMTSNWNMTNIQFDSAKYQTFHPFHPNMQNMSNVPYGTNMMGAPMGQQPFVPEWSGQPNRDDDEVTIADDEPVFAIPGYLKMDFNADLRLKNKLAEGGGGVVYKGDLLNKEVLERIGFSDIVIKVVKPMPNMPYAELLASVNQEIAIMQALSHHPNCIKLAGYTEKPLSVIMKRYDRSLFHLVLAYPRYTTDSSEYYALKSYIKVDSRLKKGLLVKGFELLPEIALHLAWGMANGMAEMHRLGILHRDLKSANVLMEYRPGSNGSSDQPVWMRDPSLSKMSEKVSGIMSQSSLAGALGWGRDARGRPFCPVNPIICDFGLAKMIRKNGRTEENGLAPDAVKGMREAVAVGISYRYAAPEAFVRMRAKGGRDIEEKRPVDVYAFGVMCWEMLERKVPFHKSSNNEVEERVKKGERPHISPRYLDIKNPIDGNKHIPLLLRVIDSCWKQNPAERPSFDEVRNKLRRFWLGPKIVETPQKQ